MSNTWRWIIGILAGLALIGLLFYGRSERQAYRAARGAVEERVELSQDRIDASAEMAMASVDLALKLAGDLPSQQAKADLVKQDIEEINNRLNEARKQQAMWPWKRWTRLSSSLTKRFKQWKMHPRKPKARL